MLSTATEVSPIGRQPVSASEQQATGSHFVFSPLLYLSRHPYVCFGTSLLLLLLGSAYLTLFRGPVYSAQSVVYVSPARASALMEGQQEDHQYDSFMEQQVYAVTRYENLKQAIDKHRSFWMLPNEDEQNAINRLGSALKVEEMGHSYQMAITLKSVRRNGLAAFLNDITAGYLASAHRDEFYTHDATMDTLIADRQKLTEELDADLKQQDALLAELGIAQFDSKGSNNPYDLQMQKLRDQLSDAHEKLAEADAKAAIFLRQPGNTNPSALEEAAEEEVRTDPGVQSLEAQLNTRRSVLLLQMNGLKPLNPLYVETQNELATIDRQLSKLTSDATARIAQQLNEKYAAQREQAASLESELDSDLSKTRELAANAEPKLQQAEVLSSEIQRLQANYTEVDSRINSLGMDGDLPASEHVVSWAMEPTKQVSSHIVLYWGALLFACVVAGIAAGMITTLLDPLIYTGEDIRQLIGFPPIGLLLDEEDFSSQIRSDYLLRLAAGIDHAYRRIAARTFVFTSVGTGDARELTSKLGLELARNGLKTLVVHVGEPAKADQPEKVQISPNGNRSVTAAVPLIYSGSGEVLSRLIQADPEMSADMLQIVSRPALDVFSFIRLSTSYNVILVGADPLLSSAHTERLARTADCTVLVAQSGKTTKKQLTRAARLLERMRISGIAVVLSQIRLRGADREIKDNVAEYAQQAAA